jgi:Uma2 family endonuclease
MSTVVQSLVTWQEFLRLPERSESGERYELHDGEVVLVPPARPLHKKIQKRLEVLLEAAAGQRGVVSTEFPYRPVPNLQFWVADVAYILQSDWDAMPPDTYPVYAPLLIVEVLSPSNTAVEVNRQRMVALSAGTQEFWVVNAAERTIHLTSLSGARVYASGERVPLALIGGSIAIDEIFAV